jgi:Lipocalin-like domain
MRHLRSSLIVLLLATNGGFALAQDSLKSKLLGAWRLTSYFAESSNGNVVYPLGQDASGYIMYTADGHMSATVMRVNRVKFASADAMGGTPDEHATAAAGYLSYAGTFEVDDVNSVVIHHLKTALVPNWVGNDFKRKVILDGDKLELRGLAPSLVGGEMRLVHVLWERAR